jgi:AP-4 complex subunit epsilon-1
MSLATMGPGDLDFAFPHAVNLAELGQSLMDKKIGEQPRACLAA